jgi:hypothetical protein
LHADHAEAAADFCQNAKIHIRRILVPGFIGVIFDGGWEKLNFRFLVSKFRKSASGYNRNSPAPCFECGE